MAEFTLSPKEGSRPDLREPVTELTVEKVQTDTPTSGKFSRHPPFSLFSQCMREPHRLNCWGPRSSGQNFFMGPGAPALQVSIRIRPVDWSLRGAERIMGPSEIPATFNCALFSHVLEPGTWDLGQSILAGNGTKSGCFLALKNPLFRLVGEDIDVGMLWGSLMIPLAPQHLQTAHVTLWVACGFSHLPESRMGTWFVSEPQDPPLALPNSVVTSTPCAWGSVVTASCVFGCSACMYVCAPYMCPVSCALQRSDLLALGTSQM